ncbi:MAG TPA: serine hydrolase domain-containing protein, partial [Cytophagales bacterium]
MFCCVTLPAARAGALLCWLALLLAGSPGATAQQQSFVANGRRVAVPAFDQAVQTMMDDIGVPASSVAIIEDGKVVYANAYGYKSLARKDKVDKNTVFEACSLTKTYLVMVAYQLVDEGKLDLDKPMHTYLPYAPLAHDPRYRQITPRMILSHCSGIENWTSFNNPDTLEIIADPGKKFVYSGEGYNYLAQVISLILGQSYEQYCKERIIRPLGLERTFVRFRETGVPPFRKEQPANYAYGHSAFGETYEKWKNAEPVPSSGNNITATDYARLVLGIFDGKHLSDRSIRDILTPVVKMEANNTYYGTGFELLYTPGDSIVNHGGDNVGFKALAFYSVARRRGFVLLTNGDLGKMMAARLNALTVQLDIASFFEKNVLRQYPSAALAYFRAYREKPVAGLLAAIDSSHAAGTL